MQNHHQLKNLVALKIKNLQRSPKTLNLKTKLIIKKIFIKLKKSLIENKENNKIKKIFYFESKLYF